MAATCHSELILGISLWALLRPSLTPVRILMVRGISPSALFIPISIFPSFPAASSTVSEESFQHFIPKTDTAKKRTSGTTACSKDKIDRTTAVQVHEVDASVTFPGYQFGCRDECGRLVSCNLYSKHCFGRVSSDQGPLLFGTRLKGCRQAHYVPLELSQ